MAYCPVCHSNDLTHYRQSLATTCKSTGRRVELQIVTCHRDLLPPPPGTGLAPLPRHWLVYRCPDCGITFGAIDQGNCFVATAVFGSASAPEVIVLREFRDVYLSRLRMGRVFIRAYYSWLGPTAARIIGAYRPLRKLARVLLGYIVRSAQNGNSLSAADNLDDGLSLH